MSNKYQRKYRISSTRMQNWDYRWMGCYFITICTQNMEHYFGEIKNGKMQLSPMGAIAHVLWHEIRNHVENIDLGEFIVMPNHVHGILILNNPYIPDDAANSCAGHSENDDAENANDAVETGHALSVQPNSANHPKNKSIGQKRFQNIGKNSISSIVGSYKSAVTKYANRLELPFNWQMRFHDSLIRDKKAFENISNYIINNPKNWEKDKFA